jgi:pimeloyl-ACP methyl ester carboxylesterase
VSASAPIPVTTATVPSADGTVIGYHTVGQGPAIIVIGGAMRAAEDYLALARDLAERYRVHVVDRRGRGLSGAQGPRYGIARECEDLLAVQAATGARAVFGHSYGGLVALETAVRSDAFEAMMLYEPGVSVRGSIPTAWMTPYRALLERGDTRGAFACFVQAFGPGPMARLPRWYMRAVLRCVIRKRRWEERYEPLLAANLAEHEQVAACDDHVTSYGAITARLLLLGGSRSPAIMTTLPLQRLQQTVPDATLDIIDGLDHLAPDEKAPEIVARRVLGFL